MRKLTLLALLLGLIAALPAAAQEPGNLVDTVGQAGNLTTFAAALEATGVAETLRGPGNYTVFAPTDEAFADLLALLGITIDELLADTARLRNLTLNHVAPGSLPSFDLLNQPDITTLSDNTLSVTPVDDTLLIGNSGRVVAADIAASNGVIHLIDRVLLPPAEATAVAQLTPVVATPEVVITGAVAAEEEQPAASIPSFLRLAHFSPDAPAIEVFVDGASGGFPALEFGQVSDWIAFPASVYQFAFAPAGSPITDALYGPVDVAITPGSWTTLAVLGSQAAQTTRVAVIAENILEPLAPENARITLFHAIEAGPVISLSVGENIILVDSVAYGDYTALDIPAAQYDFQVSDSTTGSGIAGVPDLQLQPGGHYLFVAGGTTDAPTIAVKAVTREALAAIMRGEPLPDTITAEAVTTDLLSAASADGRFTILLTVIEAAQLEETLRGPGPFTLLAPTDQAFAALPDGMMDALLMNSTALRNLLLYHIVVGEFSSSELGSQPSFMTALGIPIEVTQEDTLSLLNDGVIFIDTDIPAGNGVIHVIDAVLLPPTS